MAEWSKALDLGSSHFDGVGSNPTAAIPLLVSLFHLLKATTFLCHSHYFSFFSLFYFLSLIFSFNGIDDREGRTKKLQHRPSYALA